MKQMIYQSYVTFFLEGYSSSQGGFEWNPSPCYFLKCRIFLWSLDRFITPESSPKRTCLPADLVMDAILDVSNSLLEVEIFRFC